MLSKNAEIIPKQKVEVSVAGGSNLTGISEAEKTRHNKNKLPLAAGKNSCQGVLIKKLPTIITDQTPMDGNPISKLESMAPHKISRISINLGQLIFSPFFHPLK